MLKPLLEKLIRRENLSAEETGSALAHMMTGADPCQSAAFLALMESKGVTARELAGMARSMRNAAVRVHADYPLLDTCGTGGDGANTVNISTGAAILAAACGAKVAKHGNRAVSGKCGSADVLQALGVKIDLPPEGVKTCLNQAGIAFLFAPLYHPAMKTLAPVRKGLGIRTAVNILGPLCNPADIQCQLMGVFSERLLPVVAETLFELGVKRALVIHGQGLDELTTTGKSKGILIQNGALENIVVNPSDFGFARCVLSDLQGGDADLNARLLRENLQGKPGPVADTLALNAGYCNFLYGLSATPAEGVKLAQARLADGTAGKTLQTFIDVSNAVGVK